MATSLVLVSVLAAATIAEVALRIFLPIHTVGIQQSYQYDPVLGVRLRDSVHLFRLTDHLEEVRTNSIGTANFDDDFRGYQKLIFALGDSYTHGTGLPADESYPMQLELLLNQDTAGRYAKRFAVVNLGLAAYGGEQSLLVLGRYSNLLGSPSACLYLGSDNDYEDDRMFRRGDRHRHVVLGSPRWKGLAPALMWLGGLQVALRIKLALALLDGRVAVAVTEPRGSGRDDVSNPASAFDPNSIYDSATTIAALEWPIIDRIVRECKAKGALVVLGWSKPPTTSGSYEWLQHKANTEGLRFNDWYSRVESTRSAVPSLPIFNPHSAGHYRGWVAGQIAAGFRNNLTPLAGR